MTVNEQIERGISVLKSGDRASARKLFIAALQEDKNNAAAWLWLAACVETDQQRIDCLRQVLRLDPENKVAAKAIAEIQQRAGDLTAQPTVQQEVPAPIVPPQSAEPAVAAANVQQDAPQAQITGVTSSAPSIAEQPSVASSSPIVTPAMSVVRPYSPPAPDIDSAERLFKARPSHVQGLLAFWLFFAGAIIVSSLLRQGIPAQVDPTVPAADGFPVRLAPTIFSLLLLVVLEAVVFYQLIINQRTRYELTAAGLRIHSGALSRMFEQNGIKPGSIEIPAAQLYHAECRQSFLQRIIGTGDIYINAAVRGELANIRLRNLPECHLRIKQLLSVVNST